MYFKFKVGKNLIKVFYNKHVSIEDINKKFGVVSWFNSANKELTADVLKDESGRKYFTCSNNIVYMDELIAMEPTELVSKLKQGENINSDELVWTLMKYGINSVRLIIRDKPLDKFMGVAIRVFKSDEDMSKYKRVAYRFEELDIFKLDDNYKIKVVPINTDDEEDYGSDTYYISDLVGLIIRRKDIYDVEVA